MGTRYTLKRNIRRGAATCGNRSAGVRIQHRSRTWTRRPSLLPTRSRSRAGRTSATMRTTRLTPMPLIPPRHRRELSTHASLTHAEPLLPQASYTQHSATTTIASAMVITRAVETCVLERDDVFAALPLLPMSNRDKDAEIRALRHQITMLERQLNGSESASRRTIGAPGSITAPPPKVSATRES
jgi:hypothetical protein